MAITPSLSHLDQVVLKSFCIERFPCTYCAHVFFSARSFCDHPCPAYESCPVPMIEEAE